MTKEEKDLLLKDLIARLNTNLVCSIYRTDDEGVGYRDEILRGYCKGDIWYEFYFREDCSIFMGNVSKIKPYLYPMSSMTEEQRKEYESLCIKETTECADLSGFFYTKDNYYDTVESFDYLNKHHFDYRGLITKGFAIDATGKNIY